jgi:hypothetical protein
MHGMAATSSFDLLMFRWDDAALALLQQVITAAYQPRMTTDADLEWFRQQPFHVWWWCPGGGGGTTTTVADVFTRVGDVPSITWRRALLIMALIQTEHMRELMVGAHPVARARFNAVLPSDTLIRGFFTHVKTALQTDVFPAFQHAHDAHSPSTQDALIDTFVRRVQALTATGVWLPPDSPHLVY